MSNATVETAKSPAIGSAVGRGKGKRQATTPKPSVQQRAKALKGDAIAEAKREVVRAISLTRTQPTGTYNVGHFLTLCRTISEGKTGLGRLQEVFAEIPADSGLSDKGNRDVLSLKIAEWVAQGGPSVVVVSKVTKGKGKEEVVAKIDPAVAFDELWQLLESGSAIPADTERVKALVKALPAGKKDDAEDAATLRNLSVAFDLPVSGSKEVHTQRFLVKLGLANPIVKSSGVAWEARVDSADDAELALLEARIVARRQALATAGSIQVGNRVVASC